MNHCGDNSNASGSNNSLYREVYLVNKKTFDTMMKHLKPIDQNQLTHLNEAWTTPPPPAPNDATPTPIQPPSQEPASSIPPEGVTESVEEPPLPSSPPDPARSGSLDMPDIPNVTVRTDPDPDPPLGYDQHGQLLQPHRGKRHHKTPHVVGLKTQPDVLLSAQKLKKTKPRIKAADPRSDPQPVQEPTPEPEIPLPDDSPPASPPEAEVERSSSPVFDTQASRALKQKEKESFAKGVTGSKRLRYACPICPETFGSSFAQYNHVRIFHSSSDHAERMILERAQEAKQKKMLKKPSSRDPVKAATAAKSRKTSENSALTSKTPPLSSRLQNSKGARANVTTTKKGPVKVKVIKDKVPSIVDLKKTKKKPVSVGAKKGSAAKVSKSQPSKKTKSVKKTPTSAAKLKTGERQMGRGKKRKIELKSTLDQDDVDDVDDIDDDTDDDDDLREEQRKRKVRGGRGYPNWS